MLPRSRPRALTIACFGGRKRQAAYDPADGGDAPKVDHSARRSIAMTSVLLTLSACGPEPNAVPPDWAIGTLSNVLDATDWSFLGRKKLTLLEDGRGEYIELSCGGPDRFGPILWDSDDTGRVHIRPETGDQLLDYPLPVGPVGATVEASSECAADTLEEYHVELHYSQPGQSQNFVVPETFYRSNPCPGPCPGCDYVQSSCSMHWCEDGDPVTCEVPK
jgi:hypothetical protein